MQHRCRTSGHTGRSSLNPLRKYTLGREKRRGARPRVLRYVRLRLVCINIQKSLRQALSGLKARGTTRWTPKNHRKIYTNE